MTHHVVVGDKDELKRFFECVLAPLEDDHVYTIFSVARKKWDTRDELSRSEEALMRKILKAYDFETFYRTLKKFEVPKEALVDRNTKESIKSDVIGYYIDITPKSVARGMELFITEGVRDLLGTRTNKAQLSHLKGVEGKLFSCVARSNSKKQYKILDVDIRFPWVLSECMNILKENDIPIRWVSQTRGGYHIIIPVGPKIAELYKVAWPKIQEKYGEKIELNDRATPIPGTWQGGHLVKQVKEEKEC